MAQAQPATTKAAGKTSGKSVIIDEAVEKEIQVDVQSAAKLQEFLHGYKPQTDVRRDYLGENYFIQLNAPVPEFDSKNARAFMVSDTSNPGRSLFAHICQPGTFQRHRVINQLKTITHPNIMQIVASGYAELSQPMEERFVIIYERPAGIKLSDFLKNNPNLRNPSFLSTNVIAPLNAALGEFANLGISHGTINPETVYIDRMAMLSPCVAEPCGYSQIHYYDTLERMQCVPAGKGEGSTAQDYYALAILALYVLNEDDYFSKHTPGRLPNRILTEGTYHTFLPDEDAPEVYLDFFRGILCEHDADRWDYTHIQSWLEGKRYNVLPPPPPMETPRPFEHGQLIAYTRRQIAHVLTTNWDKMYEIMQSGRLSHWFAVSLRNKELSEGAARIANSVAEINSKNEIQLNEQYMRVLLLLDPQGPIRMGEIIFNIDGIDALYTELYATKSSSLQTLSKYIEYNMSSFWLEQQRKNAEYVVPPLIAAVLSKLDRTRTTIRNSSMGFGPERVLYDLNLEMACQSQLLSGAHVATLPALLKRLDQLAPSMAKETDPMDRHIAAFITSRLGIQHELRINELAANPTLASNRSIFALYILSMVQDRVGVVLKFAGLTHWLCLRILPLLEDIHSKTLRQKLKSLLMEQARQGKLPELAELIIQGDYATADRNGFAQAWNRYQMNAIKIEQYKSEELIDKQSASVGFRFAKTIAYITLLVSIIVTLRNV